VPLILREEVYASACLAGSVLLVAMEHFGIQRPDGGGDGLRMAIC